MRKLTLKQYEEAKRLIDEGKTIKEVAETFKWDYFNFAYHFRKRREKEKDNIIKELYNLLNELKSKQVEPKQEIKETQETLDVNKINQEIDKLNLNRYEKEFYTFYCIFYNHTPNVNDISKIKNIITFSTPQQAKSVLLTYAKKTAGSKITLDYLERVITNLNLRGQMKPKKAKEADKIIKPTKEKGAVVKNLKDYLNEGG